MQNTSTWFALKNFNMHKAKILIFDNKITVATAQFVVLFGVAVIAPLFGQQLVTGTIVNFILFVAVFLLGAKSAVLISLFPSLIALSVGILPLILTPIIPFIIMSNIILVLVFKIFSKKDYWSAVIFASIAKFGFLSIVSFLVVSFSKSFLPFVGIIGGMQLITSLSGGLMAILFINSIRKNETKK